MAKFGKIRNCLDCMMKAPPFKLLSKSELELINEYRLEVKYNEGEVIFKQGTSLTHLIILNYGLAKVYLEGTNKKNLILRYLKPSEFLGWPGAFIDNRHHFSVAAVTESLACLININIFKQILQQNSDFSLAYIKNTSEASIRRFDKLINLTQKHMHGRIASALIYINDEVYNNNTYDLSITKQDLAELTGMNKDSAGRILKEFTDSEIISVNKNKIEIINFDLLKQISEFG
ncbi:MAG: Crp/Fnr family transcriptional regulator [Bacteroidales bacterium]|nr:MAG: Crp/Fnr family transcriptional regulator [Bacteroidales bacterium]